MQLNFILSSQLQKFEYLHILSQLQKEFSEKFPGIGKIIFEIKLHSKAVYKPASVISGVIGDQLYKVKLNFERLHKGNHVLSLPDPTEICDRIKLAINKITTLASPLG